MSSRLQPYATQAATPCQVREEARMATERKRDAAEQVYCNCEYMLGLTLRRGYVLGAIVGRCSAGALYVHVYGGCSVGAV